MYALLFRLLPGPLWLRVVLAVFLIIAVLFLLVQFVFPWLDEHSPLTPDVTIDD
ncbi:hypothetical protein NBM05_12985 [Rothia sp. AR01]|uniref:DUF4175 domain-containing protein n=1 Tax=Rothia santali TaxID=2949643 RepID=A0A9X2KJA2_9MICC|nr:hypothetical protein [Rothia santali]MCP3426895.1 hypothetical protein [Rothia santali]